MFRRKPKTKTETPEQKPWLSAEIKPNGSVTWVYYIYWNFPDGKREAVPMNRLTCDFPWYQVWSAEDAEIRIYSVPEDRPFFGKIAIVDADPDITGSGHVTQVTLTSDEPVRSLSS